MPARDCARDNRPNKTGGDLGATAFDALTHWLADRAAPIASAATLERRTLDYRSGPAGSHSSTLRHRTSWNQFD
jgi:hypothetical protein